jgi:MFS family permease
VALRSAPPSMSVVTRTARDPFVYMLAAILCVNYIDRGLLPVAGALVQRDLGLEPRQLGLLFSAFWWTYAVVQIPVGWAAERFGAHRVLAAGLVVWAASTALFGMASGFATLFALRLLLGLGESVGFPSVSKLLAQAVPIEGLGTANGIIDFGFLFGPAIGTFLGGYAMAFFGWRATFVGFGLLSLLWFWPWSRTPKPDSLRRTPARTWPAYSMILRQRSLWGTGLGLFSMNYGFYFMLSWLPYYLVHERGFSTTHMAHIASVAYVVTAASAFCAGWILDRFVGGGRSKSIAYKSIMAVAAVGSVACMVAMAVGSWPVVLASIFIYQVIGGAATPGVYAIPQILAGPSATGRWVGIHNSLGNFAGIIAPALTGFIIQATGHFTAAFLVAGAVSALGLVGWVAMLPPLAPLDWGDAPTPSTQALVEL